MNEQASKDLVIEAKNLQKVFRDFWHRTKVRAVDGISFEVHRGEVIGLLGPNGSGKTTTLKMILGLLYPTKGVLRVLGGSPRRVKTKAHVGYLPEDSYLYPHLTCEETLDFYGKLFDLNGRERTQRIEQLLDMIGLKHARRRMVGEFSKGMARRIGLAQALINDPDLVVLDEPTAGLDPIGTRQVKDLILTLGRRGKTVLLSSHLLADVEDVCDRIAILYNGRFQAVGPISELLTDRDRHTLSVPEMSPDVLKRVLAILREEIGEEPEVEHPQTDLEHFFLEVVDKARREAREESGVGAGGAVAGYLAGQPGAVLDKLVSPEEQPEPAEDVSAPPQEAPSPGTPTEADEKLRKLVGPDEDSDEDSSNQ